jgi:hypothetical protein
MTPTPGSVQSLHELTEKSYNLYKEAENFITNPPSHEAILKCQNARRRWREALDCERYARCEEWNKYEEQYFQGDFTEEQETEYELRSYGHELFKNEYRQKAKKDKDSEEKLDALHSAVPHLEEPHLDRQDGAPNQSSRASKPAYRFWAKACETYFNNRSAPFPRPPVYTCYKNHCVKGEKLGRCHHCIEQLLRGSGEYSEQYLKTERLRWHPDKFSSRQEHLSEAQEMFQMIQRLIDGGDNN